MDFKKLVIASIAVAASAAVQAAVPGVSDVTMEQVDGRLVTITYTLSDAPAIITLDVQTNVSGDVWASIGGEAVCNAEGDVWRKVGSSLSGGGSTTGTITWRPYRSWPGHTIAAGGARAVVTAWALDNTPDYMVVDLSYAARADSQTYYPSADFLPGGILSNNIYRTTKLVMRKIMAKGVEWTMGSTTRETQRTAEREATHQVTLTNNYYIGVFEITQKQWALIQTGNATPSKFSNAIYRDMRPVESVCYNEIRNSSSQTADTDYDWPADPHPSSFLGLLRKRTGIDFDLPSEAQWEFAARGGHGDGLWGDGSAIQNSSPDSNLDLLARYMMNDGYIGGTTEPSTSCGATNGTAIVGSYMPNSWGLYDTAGNVWEWCLDWLEDGITNYNGKVNIDYANSSNTLSGVAGGYRMLRGGSWSNWARYCRPAQRNSFVPTIQANDFGLRVCCPAGCSDENESYAAVSSGTALATSTRSAVSSTSPIEARYRTWDESDGIALRSDKRAMMIIVR